jgi:hypothetical protein
MHSFNPEEIAHTVSTEHSALAHGQTETWPMSYVFDPDEDEEKEEKPLSKTASFLKLLAPTTRKKNLSMVQLKNDWISNKDGSIEPMNQKKWQVIQKAESRGSGFGESGEGEGEAEEADGDVDDIEEEDAEEEEEEE